jgi:hypothetical protein
MTVPDGGRDDVEVTMLPAKAARGVKRNVKRGAARVAAARPLVLRTSAAADAPDFWSFAEVEERMIEAWQLLARMPDRERAWLNVRATDGPWDKVVPDRLGKYEEDAPVRLGLRTAEVDRMETVLGWLRFARPADAKLIGLALRQLAHAQAHVDWGLVKKGMAWTGTPDALRMRYGRALTLICHSLNSAENRRAVRQA